MALNNPYALYFDGQDDRVHILGTDLLYNIVNSFTIEFYASPTRTHQIDTQSTSGTAGTSGQRYAFYSGASTVSNEAFVSVSVGTNGVSVYEHASGYMPALLVYSGSISDGDHIAIVYNDRTPSLYINGNFVKNGLTSPRLYIRPRIVYIGGDSYGWFRGTLDEIRIWDYSRSQAQIQDNMYKRLNGDESGLFLYYRFDEGAGSIVYNSAPIAALNGTITGASRVDGLVDLISATGHEKIASATAHGRATGTAKPLLGHMGWALQCDGIDDYISLGTLGDLGKNIGSSKISVTFKTPKGYAPGAPTTLYRIINDPARGLELNVRLNTERYMPNPGTYAPGKTLFYISTLAGKHIIGGHINNHTLYDGDFHELVVDYTDIKNANIHVYIDGALQTFENYTHKMKIEETPYNLDYPLLLGASNVRGDISEHAQITVQNIKITISAQPHAEYPIDEGAGTTINDTSGNGYHGTIYGASWITDALISISTISADNISASRMNIKGKLLDLGDHTQAECYFQYTTDPNFNTGIIETPHQIMTTTGEFEQLVTNLDNSNTYYYRAVADYID